MKTAIANNRKKAAVDTQLMLCIASALLVFGQGASALDRSYIADPAPQQAAASTTVPKPGFDRLLLNLTNINNSKDALPYLSQIVAELNLSAAQQFGKSITLKVTRITGSGLFVIQPSALLDPGQYGKLAGSLYAMDKMIQTVQPSFLYQPLGLYPDLPVINAQWNINAPSVDPGPSPWDGTLPPNGSINAREAWSFYRDYFSSPSMPAVQGRYIWPPSGVFAGQPNVTVAVLDTGMTLHRALMPSLASRAVTWPSTTPGGAGTAGFTSGVDMVSDADNSRDGDGHDQLPQDEGDWTARDVASCGFINEQYHPSSYHGSHVAGIIAAQAEAGIGMQGVAPQAKVIPVRVIGRCGARTEDLVDGLHWAAGIEVGRSIRGPSGMDSYFIEDDQIGGRNPQPARVINLSLGTNVAAQFNTAGVTGQLSAHHCRIGFAGSMLGTPSFPLGTDQTFRLTMEQRAINDVTARGSIVVTAAGNEGTDVAQEIPAACDNVITVGAANYSGQRAGYSNFNRDTTPGNQIVDVLAPGGEDRLQYKYPSGLAGEPSSMPMGWTASGFGYLNPLAQACTQQTPFFVPNTGAPFTNTGVGTSAWTVSHFLWWPQLVSPGFRWACENRGPGWIQPLLVDHTKSILSTLPLQTTPGSYSWSRFTGPGSGYDYMQGTSMAAPHVAGVVALMLSVNPNLTFAQVKAGLRASARPMSPGDCIDTTVPFPVEYDLSGNGVRWASIGSSDVGACGAGIADAPGAVRYAVTH